jgi:hypothetical protein
MFESFCRGIFSRQLIGLFNSIPKLRNLHGVIVMCYLASMTFKNVFHAILMLVRGSDMPPGQRYKKCVQKCRIIASDLYKGQKYYS